MMVHTLWYVSAKTSPWALRFLLSVNFLNLVRVPHLQVKLLNKLASARTSGQGGGSKVLTDMVEGLEEPAVAVELRLKIDNQSDLIGGYAICPCNLIWLSLVCFCKLRNMLVPPDPSVIMGKQC